MSKLHFQNGGEKTIEFTENEGTYIFDLITKNYRLNRGYYDVTTLIFDEKNLSYQLRKTQQTSQREVIETNSPTFGFCEKVMIDGVWVHKEP